MVERERGSELIECLSAIGKCRCVCFPSSPVASSAVLVPISGLQTACQAEPEGAVYPLTWHY